MFIFDLFKIISRADTIDDMVKAFKEIQEAIEAILNLIEQFKPADDE